MTAADLRVKIHQQIDQLSPEQLSQVSELLSDLNRDVIISSSQQACSPAQSTARDLLKVSGTWKGNDFEDCLQAVYDDRLPAEF